MKKKILCKLLINQACDYIIMKMSQQIIARTEKNYYLLIIGIYYSKIFIKILSY